jgi:hypothetical protein
MAIRAESFGTSEKRMPINEARQLGLATACVRPAESPIRDTHLVGLIFRQIRQLDVCLAGFQHKRIRSENLPQSPSKSRWKIAS